MYSNPQFVTSVELYRDGIDCPWGFRLKGGIDVEGGTPLEIIRVSHNKKLHIFVQKLGIYDVKKVDYESQIDAVSKVIHLLCVKYEI